MIKEDLNTGPMITYGKMTLFIWKECYRGAWYDWRQWGFDADGKFAIRTPWFLFYPW